MNLLALLVLATSVMPAQQPPRDAIGSVVVQRGTGPAPFVLIAVDAFGADGRNDGRIDFVYKFYTDGEPSAAHYSFAVAYIQELDGQVVISAPADRVRLTFANRDQHVRAPANDGATEFAFTNGIGVARYWGPQVESGRMCRDGGELRLDCDGACYGD